MAFCGHEFVLPALLYLKPGSTIEELVTNYNQIYKSNQSVSEVLVRYLNIDYEGMPHEKAEDFDIFSKLFYYRSNQGELPKKFPEKGVFSYTGSPVRFKQKVPWRCIDNKFYFDEEALLDCEEPFCYLENLKEVRQYKLPLTNFGEFAFNSVTFTAELIERGMNKFLNASVSYEDLYLVVPKLCTMFPDLIPKRVFLMNSYWESKHARKNNLSNSELMRLRQFRKRNKTDIIRNELKAIEHDFGEKLKNFDPYKPKVIQTSVKKGEIPF